MVHLPAWNRLSGRLAKAATLTKRPAASNGLSLHVVVGTG
jgi:hypothetical protein